jgi:DNA-binding GntR family transcriptional regulator
MTLTRAEEAADTIRTAILDGRYISGERLIEVKIAQGLGVSQNTVRDALRILEQEGWVVKTPRHGVHVRNFTATDAAEVCTLISAVGVLALEWAMQRMDKVARADLRAQIAASRKAAHRGDHHEAVVYIWSFHDKLNAAAQKPLTVQLLDSLYNQIRLLEALRQARAPRPVNELHGLLDIYDALLRLIDAGDAAAASAQLRSLLSAYSTAMVAALRL